MENIKNKKYKILLTGGGTGGSVTPLLAIAEELKNINYEFLWIGTKYGIEKEMVERAGIKFKPIFSGKFRRYFSLLNFFDIFKIKIGFWQAFFIFLKWRPDLVISAGSFASVPVACAAWLLGVKILIHQQDVKIGLANKIMALFASAITTVFEKSLIDYGKKAIWTGNPIRKQFLIFNSKFSIKDLKKKFNLQENLPTVLIVGGGTGAMAINNLAWKSLDKLTKFCQIIHLTGKNKINTKYKTQNTKYKKYDFLNADQIAEIYCLSDIVVSRCGINALTELSYFNKPVILIPLPDSHQEDNADVFAKNSAAVVLNQKELTSEKLIDEIKKIIENKELQKTLSENIKKIMKQGANRKMVEIIKSILYL